MKFSDLGLIEPLLRAVASKGYTSTTPIQRATIPAVLEGKDLMASAQTGTGKTAAFIMPILQGLGAKSTRTQIRALILTPTRELAQQVHDSAQTYGKHLSVESAVVYGGVNITPQTRKLNKGVDLLVATPGRLLDLYQQQVISFEDIEVFVLDEADRMLDMGFIHDLKKIQSLLPKKKQTLLFSATFSDEIRGLAKKMLRHPLEVDVAPRNSTVDSIRQWIHPVDKKQKGPLLAFIVGSNNWQQVLVFNKTKHGANKLVRQLNDWNISSLAIHGNKSQAQRTKALTDFKNGKISVLVATDIAARGIDIIDLPHVINFDLPHVPEDYVHRIGRTGRAGNSGEAISLVSADEIKQLRDIEKLINRSLERIEIEGFEPDHQLPESHRRSVPNQKPNRNNSKNRKRSDHGKVTKLKNKPRRPRRRKQTRAA